MMFSGRTTTTVSAPAPGPMDLNEAGRPQWRELLPLFGIVLLGVLVAGVGGVIAMAAWPQTEYDANGWRWLGVGTGAAFAWGGGSVAWSLRAALVRSIARYQSRVDEWHYAMLDKYEQGDGKIVAQQVKEWEYNPLDLRSLLLAYTAILVSQPSKLTVEELERNGLWLRLDTRQIKVLDFTQDSAAQFLNLLAEGKVIEGRGPRQAGRVLVDQPASQAKRLLKLALRDPRTLAMLDTQQEV